MANIFFNSGLGKISNWDTTIAMFEDLYQVPLLSPEVAAYMATTAELALSVFLVLGLATRFSAFLLFIMVVVIQYGLGEDFKFDMHYYWMFLFLMLVVKGAGRFSIDRIIRKKFLGSCWHGYAGKDKKNRQ